MAKAFNRDKKYDDPVWLKTEFLKAISNGDEIFFKEILFHFLKSGGQEAFSRRLNLSQRSLRRLSDPKTEIRLRSVFNLMNYLNNILPQYPECRESLFSSIAELREKVSQR